MSNLISKLERLTDLLIALFVHFLAEYDAAPAPTPAAPVPTPAAPAAPAPAAAPPAPGTIPAAPAPAAAPPAPVPAAPAPAAAPPAPAVPAAPAPAAAPPAPGTIPAAPAPAAVKRDIDGVPWDARIHAGNGGTTSKGQWRKKKGVAKAVYEAVMAEIAHRQELVPPPPPPPPPPTASAVPAPAPISTFVELMGAATKAGKSLDDVTASALKFGVGTAAMLNTPEYLQLIPSVAQDMGLSA